MHGVCGFFGPFFVSLFHREKGINILWWEQRTAVYGCADAGGNVDRDLQRLLKPGIF